MVVVKIDIININVNRHLCGLYFCHERYVVFYQPLLGKNFDDFE